MCEAPEPQIQDTKQTVVTELPAYEQEARQRLYGKASSIANEPYTPYGGPRLSDFSPDQAAGFDLTRGNVGSYTPGMNAAFQATQGAATTFPNADLASYMNPYSQNVTDIAAREAQRAYDINRQGISDSAVKAGSFGGSRHGVVEAEASRNHAMNMGDIYLKGGEAAFRNAGQLFNADADRLLKAGSQYGTLAGLQQGYGLKDAAGLTTIGEAQQAQGQKNLDLAYSNFQEQRDYPRNQVNWLANIIKGTSLPQGSTTTGQQVIPQASPISQAAGLATTGLGLWGLYKSAFSRGGRVGYAEGGMVGGIETLSTEDLRRILTDPAYSKDEKVRAQQILIDRKAPKKFAEGGPSWGGASMGNPRWAGVPMSTLQQVVQSPNLDSQVRSEALQEMRDRAGISTGQKLEGVAESNPSVPTWNGVPLSPGRWNGSEATMPSRMNEPSAPGIREAPTRSALGADPRMGPTSEFERNYYEGIGPASGQETWADAPPPRPYVPGMIPTEVTPGEAPTTVASTPMAPGGSPAARPAQRQGVGGAGGAGSMTQDGDMVKDKLFAPYSERPDVTKPIDVDIPTPEKLDEKASPWMAITKAGLAMMSAKPGQSALSGIGEGGLQGLDQYAKDVEGAKKNKQTNWENNLKVAQQKISLAATENDRATKEVSLKQADKQLQMAERDLLRKYQSDKDENAYRQGMLKVAQARAGAEKSNPYTKLVDAYAKVRGWDMENLTEEQRTQLGDLMIGETKRYGVDARAGTAETNAMRSSYVQQIKALDARLRDGGFSMKPEERKAIIGQRAELERRLGTLFPEAGSDVAGDLVRKALGN